MAHSPLIVDAHLDLAYNAVRGRAVLRPAFEQAADEQGIPSVGLPDLRAGGVGLVCATIFCEPAIQHYPNGYHNSDEAKLAAERQLQWYQRQVDDGEMVMVRRPDELPAIDTPVRPSAEGDAAKPPPLPFILLLEGADPFRSPADVAAWFEAGLRIVGLAWGRTRYAGGTGAPGPLTAEGVDLVEALESARIIHDTSHLAEASFWQLLDLAGGPVMASHSNCRSIVPSDRQLSDEMIRALVRRDGVIGMNFFDKFLLPPEQHGKRRATLADVVHHIRHICELAGDDAHVAIGTDMDGGLGRDQIPREIQTSADLPRLADALSSAGFTDPAIRGILGENWLRFFQKALPAD